MRHGFLLIDKPEGCTSHDVVGMARKALSERSIGHLGTLDPAATGLLVLAVGKKALKVVELFAHLTKEYVADIRFGSVSTTYDREGVMEEVAPPKGWNPPEHAIVQRLIADRFVGRIKQVPPAHSAISIGGERAYAKARQGRAFNIPPREVEITRCKILSYQYPDLQLDVACGSGTYIRSLAHDLGTLMHCGAYLAGLRRTKVGEWSVEEAVTTDRIDWVHIRPLKDVLTSFPRRDLTDSEMDEVRYGRTIEAELAENTIGWHADLPVAIFRPVAEGVAHARKVFF